MRVICRQAGPYSAMFRWRFLLPLPPPPTDPSPRRPSFDTACARPATSSACSGVTSRACGPRPRGSRYDDKDENEDDDEEEEEDDDDDP